MPVNHLYLGLVLLLFVSCKNNGPTHSEHTKEDLHQSIEIDKRLLGNWNRQTDDSIKRVIVFDDQFKWQYFKDETQVEKGTFHLNDDVITLKHIVDHSKSGHEHPADHHYHYSFNESKDSLLFISHGDTSLYVKAMH